MYIGEPQSVAAIVFPCRYRAKPKSAGERGREKEKSMYGAKHKIRALVLVVKDGAQMFTESVF